ncbi:TldD/PmbA family protein [Halobacteriovorax sp. HLS]|uniref:TldD/PmbA family protein n=1 Tax=Halobacteriovorax sp. HLS TaxID=2234000 RepID=UPI000FD98B48|nr:TldD/PmbA family protein [Halobacteriovorax sp. HLS]
MLDKTIASEVIDYALMLGADFCEIFVEKHNSKNLSILNSSVHEIKSGIDFGIGIRLIYGTKVLYGYTNIAHKDELLRITRALAAQDKRDALITATPLNFMKVVEKHQALQGLSNTAVQTEEKIQYLLKIDKAARAQSEQISQVSAGLLQRLQNIEIFNSEGLHVTDERNYSRVMANAIATNGTEQSTGYDAPGALSGWEFTNSINPTQLGEAVSKQALVKLTADDCPAGKMPVVIDNGFGGVIFHEACGHSLETTSVQKKASVFWDKMGEQIAHSAVSAVDDGTINNYWGSINIDDEGMPTQKTQLIKDGKLTSFLVDKVGAMRTGYERTGSGRRQSYKYAPASRMRNTYIEAGNYSLDEIIQTIDNGIYCKKMGGGSVTPATGEFNFSAQESYIIKNGKIDRPLKGATLIGTGAGVLQKISMVGKNLEMAAGMCGSVSGSIPTSVGQPAVKVDEILVGGKA